MMRLSFLCCLCALTAFSQQARVYMTEPHLSPNRSEIVFVSGGDIWRVAVNGGDASLLVSHPADESRPLFSPDGSQLAFLSTRTGGGDIYVLQLATGITTRITFDSGMEMLDAWSRDGKWLYFHSSSQDIGRMNDVFRVKSTGGTPMPVAADRYANEFFSAPSPDGSMVAINARGAASQQWWRKGHSNLDRSEIWLVKPGATPVYERVSDGAAREIWPMWAPDGKSFYFVSDRTGVENIWRQPVGGTSRQVSQFKDGRVLWPTLSYDGKLFVFERDFTIWKMDPNNAKATAIPIHLRGAAPTPSVTHHLMEDHFNELAVSPDGRKVAFTVRGEVFATSSDEGGQAVRVSRTHGHETQLEWAPDSIRLAYVSDRGGPYNVYLYNFASGEETKLTSAQESDVTPRFSPNGKMLAYLRGGQSVWVYDIEAKQERQIASGDVARQPIVAPRALAWSPDSRYVAFAARGAKGFTNVEIASLDGKPARPVSFLSNSSIRNIAFHPSGKYLLFDTAQRTEIRRIARVDLVPQQSPFREEQFQSLFAVAPAKEPAIPAIDFDQIRSRISFLPLGLDVDTFLISPDGKSLFAAATSSGRDDLYSYSLDETQRTKPSPRQVTSNSEQKSFLQWASSAKQLFYIEKGKIQHVALQGSAPKTLAVQAEFDVDFHKEKLELMHQAWTYQRDHFFDEKYNGVDWEAMRKQYQPLIESARTPSEVYRLLSYMMGELNASHLGVTPPEQQASQDGYLGLAFDPVAYESKGLFLVREVIPLSPAAIAGVKAGQRILAVDNVALTADSSLQSLLEFKKNRRVTLTVTEADGSQPRSLPVMPAPLAEIKELTYRAWVDGRRAFVEAQSGGRLGYVHMLNMSEEALERLHLDLDVANHSKQGVVIDIRNNSGGFVNAYALDVFSRRPYLTFQERGRNAVPARAALGQRSLELPTILVTNQHSLSDAEDFTEGYRRLRLGKVVGEPTAGWIVYTWNQTLIDGSSLRMPRTKVFDNDGVLMEMHPRPVDIPVERNIGEAYTSNDVQLETAVRELLQQIDTKARPTQ
ncbi:MAG: S41 family peptidase [Bryobacteraceae bacterium]